MKQREIRSTNLDNNNNNNNFVCVPAWMSESKALTKYKTNNKKNKHGDLSSGETVAHANLLTQYWVNLTLLAEER